MCVAKTAFALSAYDKDLSEKVAACLLLALASFVYQPVSTARLSADSPMPGAAAQPTASLATKRDEQRSQWLKSEYQKSLQVIGKALSCDAQAASASLSSLYSNRKVVSGLHKRTAVIGLVDSIATAASGVVIEDCAEANVYVTAAVPFVIVRRCKKCLIACVPSGISVYVEDTSNSAVTAAAPVVSLKNCTGLALYTWAQHPVACMGDLRDVSVGCYNATAPGLVSNTSLHSWSSTGSCAIDASSSDGAGVRSMRADEFYWRHLPFNNSKTAAAIERLKDAAPQQSQEMEWTSVSHTFDVPSAIHAETLAQGAFVVGTPGSVVPGAATQLKRGMPPLTAVNRRILFPLLQTWLLDDTKALSLKNNVR